MWSIAVARSIMSKYLQHNICYRKIIRVSEFYRLQNKANCRGMIKVHSRHPNPMIIEQATRTALTLVGEESTQSSCEGRKRISDALVASRRNILLFPGFCCSLDFMGTRHEASDEARSSLHDSNSRVSWG